MALTKAMKKSMFDEFQIKGYWWLPNKEKEVAGILYYKHDEIELELLGSLNDAESMFDSFGSNKTKSDTSIILGISDAGEKFTLLDSMNIKSNVSSGFSTETYAVHLFLVGANFTSKDDLLFHSFAIYPTYYNKWNAEAKYKPTHHLVDGRLGRIKGIDFSESEMFSEYVHSISTKLEETNKTNMSGDIHEEVNWEYKGGIMVTPDEWQDIEWGKDMMSKIKDLFTLFIGFPIYYESITFYGKNKDVGNSTFREKCQLFIEQKNVKIRSKFNWYDVTVRYGDIKDNLGQVFNLWFEKEEMLKTVVNLYISDFYRDSYLETKFLNAVQTLEIYHRKVYDGKLFDEDDFEEYTSKVLSYVQEEMPDEFIKKMKGMLQHANEYSLSKRLRELINQNLEKETKSYLFGNSDNRGKFVQQLVDTRNYLTHYDEGEKKNILKDGIQIYYAVQRLKALITLILFKEVGVDETIILDKFKENRHYTHSILTAKEQLNN
ncbi:ApeA N-terminal domain 1-containing protein [Oceanobacillus halotolerans]|uniref:ApeA N-terminal domain 1-containing protein n=1 Tax=Oceanobacillus halotolerans TaxID=2663380 RepID=UPI0013DC6E5E|nr:HEPN domain-containing protein [Oceanobacillus halotolerans]